MTSFCKIVSVSILFLGLSDIKAKVPIDSAAHDAYVTLTHICDEFGGRLTGSTANEKAMAVVSADLKKIGLNPTEQNFSMPGWERGDDKVWLTEPYLRPLRVAAIGYTPPCDRFEANLIDIGDGSKAHFSSAVAGKILLLDSSSILVTREIDNLAYTHGAKAVLFIDREAGGQLLARTGSFIGESLRIPIFSITQEEGRRFQRLLALHKEVKIRVEVKSRCIPIKTKNLSVVFPGAVADRIIVGAHFDSWDLGQGALDNGLGVAQLIALAHVLKELKLTHTVELVWFNGEEQGLWGSRYFASHIGDTPVVAMVNLDMVGVPIAVNALGDKSLVQSLESWNIARGTHKLPLGVQNINWFGSDHTPFQLAGIRAITFNGPIPRDSVRYYHDYADTIDKLSESLVVDSTTIIGDLILSLAQDNKLTAFRRPRAETMPLFTVFDLDRRMKAIGYWPF
jgi:hypothetical protein